MKKELMIILVHVLKDGGMMDLNVELVLNPVIVVPVKLFVCIVIMKIQDYMLTQMVYVKNVITLVLLVLDQDIA